MHGMEQFLTCIHVVQYLCLPVCSRALRGWRSVLVLQTELFDACHHHAIEVVRVSPRKQFLAGGVEQTRNCDWFQHTQRERSSTVSM